MALENCGLSTRITLIFISSKYSFIGLAPPPVKRMLSISEKNGILF
jgi:hypothetical protein